MKSKSLLLLPLLLIIAGCGGSTETIKEEKSVDVPSYFNLDTVKAGRFDTGKMWTFEYPPFEYFKEEYDFTPTQGWLDSIRLGALRFATYCSASFISADGLIMTNDHCARESSVLVSGEGESISDSGYYAETQMDERKVPELFVDQLVLIKDITDQILSETEKISDYSDRTIREQQLISEITEHEQEKTGLEISIVSLFNGGRFSLYGYKRFNDVRLVFTPESQLGYFGGDYDNFTYPRYNLDCSFFRVYDDSGRPVRSDNYFKWDLEGAEDGEAVFVVGNPGSTTRLNTVAQLEYARDYLYPQILGYYRNMINVYNGLIEENPDKKDEYTTELLKFTNSQKAIGGYLKGLQDPYLMQKKRDFEKKFRTSVEKDKELNSKYGDVWDKIAGIRERMREMSRNSASIGSEPMISPEYVFIAQELLNIAAELTYPEEERGDIYQGAKLDSLISSLFPENFDKNQNRELLIDYIETLYKYPGRDDPVIRNFTGGKEPVDAADYILSKTILTGEESVRKLIDKGADAIESSDDPFIVFEIEAEKRDAELQAEMNHLSSEEEKYNKLLGKALFEVFGTSIPPDATFTLRLADGVIKGFDYNGTVAPPFTTFYGLYDRYYSFDMLMPWDLPGKWKNPPDDFKLETPFNFSSTNDIIGGNSGSPVLNKAGKVIGLAFDGNMGSLPGDFIYTTDENRMIGLDVRGIIEALTKIYKADRLVKEIMRSGK